MIICLHVYHHLPDFYFLERSAIHNISKIMHLEAMSSMIFFQPRFLTLQHCQRIQCLLWSQIYCLSSTCVLKAVMEPLRKEKSSLRCLRKQHRLLNFSNPSLSSFHVLFIIHSINRCTYIERKRIFCEIFV